MDRPPILGLLHDHIDGSLAVRDIIHELYRAARQEFPFPSVAAWVDFFQNPQENIIRRFRTVTDVLQTKESLRRLGYAYGVRRSLEGYVYVEAKFAPQYHIYGGLTIAQAAAAMIAGLRQAERDCPIRIMPHLCIGREAPPEIGLQVAMVCLGYAGEVAMDLACDEANHPPEKHQAAFDLTYGTAVKRDCHAGEWVSPEPRATYRQRLLENGRTAVRLLRADRVSHFIPLADDWDLVREMVDKGIGLAGSPAAYAAARLIGDIRELRIPELLDAGIRYTLNHDDDLFLPPMPQVLAACAAPEVGLGESHWQQLADNVFLDAFAPDADRYRPAKCQSAERVE